MDVKINSIYIKDEPDLSCRPSYLLLLPLSRRHWELNRRSFFPSSSHVCSRFFLKILSSEIFWICIFLDEWLFRYFVWLRLSKPLCNHLELFFLFVWLLVVFLRVNNIGVCMHSLWDVDRKVWCFCGLWSNWIVAGMICFRSVIFHLMFVVAYFVLLFVLGLV